MMGFAEQFAESIVNLSLFKVLVEEKVNKEIFQLWDMYLLNLAGC